MTIWISLLYCVCVGLMVYLHMEQTQQIILAYMWWPLQRSQHSQAQFASILWEYFGWTCWASQYIWPCNLVIVSTVYKMKLKSFCKVVDMCKPKCRSTNIMSKLLCMKWNWNHIIKLQICISSNVDQSIPCPGQWNISFVLHWKANNVFSPLPADMHITNIKMSYMMSDSGGPKFLHSLWWTHL